jgi:hypothetical protein
MFSRFMVAPLRVRTIQRNRKMWGSCHEVHPLENLGNAKNDSNTAGLVVLLKMGIREHGYGGAAAAVCDDV